MKTILDENNELNTLNEMFVNVLPHIPPTVENSIYYNRLKVILQPEIINFCREKIDLRNDLMFLRSTIGTDLDESSIRAYFDALKEKYNSVDNNIGLDYHLESTKIDYGVALFVIIKRTDISMKKFVFRYRKTDISSGIEGLTNTGVPT